MLAEMIQTLIGVIKKTKDGKISLEKNEVKSESSEPYVCPHKDRVKIAKNMCSYCYNKIGKTKRAHKC